MRNGCENTTENETMFFETVATLGLWRVITGMTLAIALMI
jgi:hypothetical protein